MSMKEIKGSVSRSSFDLSGKNVFSAKISEILPVSVVHCIPDDYYDIDVTHFTRTSPVNTAAYTRIQEHFNWYFVPYQQIWNKFNSFYTQMKDNVSVAESLTLPSEIGNQHPYFTTHQIYDYIYQLNSQETGHQSKTNYFGFNRPELTCKLLHYMGYGDFYPALTQELDGSDPNNENIALNPFALLAYHKIYYDHIRNSQWEKNYAPAYNINYLSGLDGFNNIPISQLYRQGNPYENLFDIHYSNWNKDMFMGVLPNSQFGDVATIMASDIPFGVAYTGLTINQSNSNVATNDYGQLVANTSNSWTLTNISNIAKSLGVNTEQLSQRFSILALRQAEAVQRLKEIQQSHSQDFKAQMEARWHVSLSDAQSELCKWLGGDSSMLDITEVVNNNLNESQDSQAVIKGKGVGVGKGSIKFKTEVPGILMCLYHAVPVLDYSISGINPHNLKTYWTDYAQPELDRTGMVSVPTITLVHDYNLNQNHPFISLPKLLGYAPRYYEYKTGLDQVHGSFYNGGEENWIAPFTSEYIYQYILSLGDWEQSEWSFFANIDYRFFKISPSIVNPIFAVNAGDGVDTDQLKVNSFFKIYAVRNLDYDGLPYK